MEIFQVYDREKPLSNVGLSQEWFINLFSQLLAPDFGQPRNPNLEICLSNTNFVILFPISLYKDHSWRLNCFLKSTYFLKPSNSSILLLFFKSKFNIRHLIRFPKLKTIQTERWGKFWFTPKRRSGHKFLKETQILPCFESQCKFCKSSRRLHIDLSMLLHVS